MPLAHARPVVFHIERHRTIRQFRPQNDPRITGVSRVLLGIVDQVAQNLLEQVRIGFHAHIAGGTVFDHQLLAGGGTALPPIGPQLGKQ